MAPSHPQQDPRSVEMSNLESSTFVSPSTEKEFHYLTAGPSDGPLIILLHGWPGIALTWKYQLESFGRLGYYAVAPDMPGYGKTWTSADHSDFALEKLVPQFLELLGHLGRQKAIWFGHDWGCGPLWAIAAHYPEVCNAVIGMSVPYRTLELGFKGILSTIDRDLYPESRYPYGQWDYQAFYEEDSEAANRALESNIPNHVKMLFSKGNEEMGKGVARTSEVRKNGGWFGGPNARLPDFPLQNTVIDQDLFDKLTESLTRNRFHGATSWYLNHASNEKYGHQGLPNDGKLKMPVLFIHTEYDAVCQTVYNPKLMEEMRSYCENLQEFVIKTAHWGMLERSAETNAGVIKWLLQEVPDLYPGSDPERK